jgi:hypothetical protein
MRRNLVALLVVSLSLAAAKPSWSQVSQAQPIESRVRFEGVTRLGPPKADSVRVDIRLWSIDSRQKIERLELPFSGVLTVELRGGHLTTIIAGRRVERQEGEIWSVPAETAMGLETGSDKATLQTTLVEVR